MLQIFISSGRREGMQNACFRIWFCLNFYLFVLSKKTGIRSSPNNFDFRKSDDKNPVIQLDGLWLELSVQKSSGMWFVIIFFFRKNVFIYFMSLLFICINNIIVSFFLRFSYIQTILYFCPVLFLTHVPLFYYYCYICIFQNTPCPGCTCSWLVHFQSCLSGIGYQLVPSSWERPFLLLRAFLSRLQFL